MTTHHLSKVRPLGSTNKASIIAGFFAAFFTGLLACTWMTKIVKRSKLSYFSFYCFAVGLAAIIWSIV
jgi:undecaprenyl-diphosphatase